MGKFKDLTGLTFGSLTVLGRADVTHKNAFWRCLCACGSPHVVKGSRLRRGETSSCGCGKGSFKHGFASRKRHPLYKTWEMMIQRCELKTHPSFKHYGARGIAVCDRWRHSFPNFLADMGGRPEGKTLDRIDNDGPYSPENCRWATRKEQRLNQRPPSRNPP